MATVTSVTLVQQSLTSKNLIGSWKWTKDKTSGYVVRWWYKTKAGKTILGEEKTVSYYPRIASGSNSTFSYPDDAVLVWITVKPFTNSTKTVKKKQVPSWEASWSKEVHFKPGGLYPSKPSTPTAELEYRPADKKYYITCRLDNIDSNDCPTGSELQFHFYRDDKYWTSSKGVIKARSCGSSKEIEPGHTYKVCCRILKKYGSTYLTGEWSDFSSGIMSVPDAPSGFTVCKAMTESSVMLEWTSVKNATSYDIAYAADPSDFYVATNPAETGITSTSYLISGLESGIEYFFRVRAANGDRASAWSPISSTILGTKPAAPTTWSATTTASVGDLVNLYWVHNSLDGSSQTKAKVELDIDGEKESHEIDVVNKNVALNGFYYNDISDMSKAPQITLPYTLTQFGGLVFNKPSNLVRNGWLIFELNFNTVLRRPSTFGKARSFRILVTDRYVGVLSSSTSKVVSHMESRSRDGTKILISVFLGTTSEFFDSSKTYMSIAYEGDDKPRLLSISARNGYVDERKEDWDETDETESKSSYTLDTSTMTEGAKVLWRVQTKGVLNEYGDWSTQRTVDVYAKPTLALGVVDSSGDQIEQLAKYPFYVTGTTSPSTQKPIGYYISIVSNEDYETVDDLGNVKYVKAGEEIYSKNLDTSELLAIEFSAHNLNLENNQTYTINAFASMDSGLTTETVSYEFKVAWDDEEFEVDAEVLIDDDLLIAYVRPYCVLQIENAVEHGTIDNDMSSKVLFSVYRREFDGTFTELSKDGSYTNYVTDIHPALDYARYRVVGKSEETGSIVYYDVPIEPVLEKAIVIQWDEVKKDFEVADASVVTDEEPWTGSMLKLPYNVDVADNYKPDVSLISYVGRENPVSYYGTQRGSTATWNVEIERDDEETLYALRRLARWMGDVYVREPSGSGYWANVVVSFSQKHCTMTIPVTLSITRVEGGA